MQTVSCRIGLDDTDHHEIGCTTESMQDLIMHIIEKTDCEILERRLVRLWPFAERRTRGNGALGALLKMPIKQRELLVEVCKEWFSRMLSIIEEYPKSRFAPSPCLLISFETLPEEWYWESVRGYVDPDERYDQATEKNCEILYSDSKFGVVGACAAVAWKPRARSTWEIIAWRQDSRIGKKRVLSKDSVLSLEREHPLTFMNRDPTKGNGLIAPRTPCPVLYGIRGSSESVVNEAHSWLQKRNDVEPCKSFASHITNQLSDDHIEAINSGTVISMPSETKGGHAFTRVFSGISSEELVAFAETGPINRALRKLIPGDRITWAGLKSPDGSIHLEKLRVDDHSPRILGRPVCCSTTMRSAGKGQDLRCLECGKSQKKKWVCERPESLSVLLQGKWMEPSPSNMRHLSKPISHIEKGTR